ncbi:MAG: hypothetical protein ACOYMN_20305, partial [Roseimicrobium sp.]
MKSLLLTLLCVSAVSALNAQTAAAVSDPDLPKPITPEDVSPLIAASPFTRSLNLSDSLVLTGIAY